MQKVLARTVKKLVVAARKLIDMRDHHGAHGRMGAVDVCPFVPVAGVTMDDCVEFANRLGKRVGEELGLPVFLYEYAATRPTDASTCTASSSTARPTGPRV